VNTIKYLQRLWRKAYSPYSNYKVSALAIGKNREGRVIMGHGVNVENASYGLTLCAERVAISNAIVRGMVVLEKVYIMTEDGLGNSCGACLQVMQEFCDLDCEIHYYDKTGKLRNFSFLSEVLPYPFKLKK